MSEPIIRLSRPNDINNLVALDLKSYAYPMELKEWQGLVGDSGKVGFPRIVVIDVNSHSVGFAMWQYIDKQTNLLRLGVLPNLRKCGLGSVLLSKCMLESSRGGMDKVRAVVPEIHCCPGDPDDVSSFLNQMKFKATGEIVPDYKEMYGDTVDGYVFERKVTL